MPADDSTRYTPTDPPTLAQLRAMLESVTKVKAHRTVEGNRTTLTFEIDALKVHEKGGSCYATGEQIAKVLLDTISRMEYFDQVMGDYANVDRKGTTVADIQAFINNELKHVPPSGDLASIMRRRMYSETLQKLVELGVWRAAIDASRFQNAREAERKRQERERASQERWRKEQHAREEREERMRQAEEAFREAYKDHRETGTNSNKDYRSDFESAFSGGADWRKMWEEEVNAFYHGSFHQRRGEPKRPKARNKEARTWQEVLEVPTTATDEEVKKAYRRMIARYHPDRCKDADAKERTQEIVSAWNTISESRGIK